MLSRQSWLLKTGVVKGHLETIHAYTNDQNLVDNMQKNTVAEEH
jgi:glyceraldehyde-3-phosphate dehydrogenase/erythrose-4-phosphate dehydrogenase